MRLAGRVKMGFYATPLSVVDAVRTYLAFPENESFAALDPCAGEGEALASLLRGTAGCGYGIELDRGRAAEAEKRLHRVAWGAFELAKVSRNAFSLVWLNPPYDYAGGATWSPSGGERVEYSMLKRASSLLVPDGVLVYIVPQKTLAGPAAAYLDYKYRDLLVSRFPDPYYAEYRQIVVFGVKKDPPSSSAVRTQRLARLAEAELEVLCCRSEPLYPVPVTPADVPVFEGGSVSEEGAAKAAAASPVWGRLRAMFSSARDGAAIRGRPPVPLHSGHVALLLAAGHLDGLVGEGPDAHLVRGTVRRVVLPLPDDGEASYGEDGDRVKRELCTYAVQVTVLTPDGRSRVLVGGGRSGE